MTPTFVPDVPNVVVAATAQTTTAKAKKDGRGNNMKWHPFISTFVLNKMCELVSSGVRTGVGVKTGGSRVGGPNLCVLG